MFKWYEDDDMVVRIEIICDIAFWHITLHNWNKKVLKNVLLVKEAVVQELDEMGFSNVFSYTENQDEVWFKFCEKLGMFVCGYTPDTNNRVYCLNIGE